MWLATTNVPYGAQPVMTDQQCEWWKARNGREKPVDSHVQKSQHQELQEFEVRKPKTWDLGQTFVKICGSEELLVSKSTSEVVKVWSNGCPGHESASLKALNTS